MSRENLARKKAEELQKQLTDAQTSLIEARTKALKNGDALIKIDGDGLDPALEATLWKILGKVKINFDAGKLKEETEILQLVIELIKKLKNS